MGRQHHRADDARYADEDGGLRSEFGVGEVDPHGHEFLVQSLCVADEIASAAELVKGNVSRIPAVVVRGFSYQSDEEATMQDVLRDPQNDLFR